MLLRQLLINVLHAWCLALRVTQTHPHIVGVKRTPFVVLAEFLRVHCHTRVSCVRGWGSRHGSAIGRLRSRADCLEEKTLPILLTGLCSLNIYLLTRSRNDPSIQRGWRWSEIEWTYCWALGRLVYWRGGLRGVEFVISHLTRTEIGAGMHWTDKRAQIFTLQVRQLRPSEVKRPARSHWAGWLQDWLSRGYMCGPIKKVMTMELWETQQPVFPGDVSTVLSSTGLYHTSTPVTFWCPVLFPSFVGGRAHRLASLRWPVPFFFSLLPHTRILTQDWEIHFKAFPTEAWRQEGMDQEVGWCGLWYLKDLCLLSFLGRDL